MTQGISGQTAEGQERRAPRPGAAVAPSDPQTPPRDAADPEAWARVAARYGDAAAPLTSQTGPALLAAADLRPRTEFLDLGCGVGALAAAAQIFGALATGVDLAPAMIAAAEAAPGRRGAAFRIGDARALDARAGSFDAVAANFSVLESGAPERTLAEAHRALREEGRLSWTLWPGPSGGRLFELVAAARLAALGPERGAARPLGVSVEQATALTSAAGFAHVAAVYVPLYLEARAETALAAVEALDAPGGAVEGAERARVLAALSEALAGLTLLETEAIIVTARKPSAAARAAAERADKPAEKAAPMPEPTPMPEPEPAMEAPSPEPAPAEAVQPAPPPPLELIDEADKARSTRARGGFLGAVGRRLGRRPTDDASEEASTGASGGSKQGEKDG